MFSLFYTYTQFYKSFQFNLTFANIMKYVFNSMKILVSKKYCSSIVQRMCAFILIVVLLIKRLRSWKFRFELAKKQNILYSKHSSSWFSLQPINYQYFFSQSDNYSLFSIFILSLSSWGVLQYYTPFLSTQF